MPMPSSPDEQRLSELEAKWLNGTITEAEAKEYASWYNEGQDLPVQVPAEMATSEAAHRQRILKNINRKRERPVATVRLLRWSAAAATLILLLVGLYLYRNKSDQNTGSIAKITTPP